MPKLMIVQLCEEKKPACRFFIGGVASALYHVTPGLICFPMKVQGDLQSIDFDEIIRTATYGLSKVAFDQDAAPVLFEVWKAAYPCEKPRS